MKGITATSWTLVVRPPETAQAVTEYWSDKDERSVQNLAPHGDPADDLSGPKPLSKLDANTVNKDTVSRRDFASASLFGSS
jgi:hypothetical protein